jgi:drug/metabolite transporter (DMT)-like permease
LLNASPPKASVAAAVAWMLAAVLALTAMGVAGRELSVELTPWEIVFFRNVIGLAAILALALRYGGGILRTSRLALHGARNVVHFAAQVGWYIGLTYLPLVQVFCIEFTAPIWTALMAAMYLGERLTPARAIAVLLGFAGTVVILRPGVGQVDLAALAVLAASVGYAFAYVTTKALTGTDSALTILFYMNLIQLPLAGVFSLPTWVTPSPALWPWIAVTGLAGLASHYCLARAFARAEAGIVAPIDFIRLPLAALIGYLAYNETVDAFVAVGAVVILLANGLNLRAQRPPPPRVVPPADLA